MYQLRINAAAPAGLLLAGLLLAGLLLAGCAGAGSTGAGHTGSGHTGAGSTGGTGQASATGQLAGRLVMAGGPVRPGGGQPSERPMAGLVTVTAAGHKPVTVTVGSSGAFSVALPPGRYQVAGGSPAIMEVNGGHSREVPCSQPASATVTAGHTATITLTCVVP